MGSDNIHPKVIKECSNALAEPLIILFNKSLSEGKLPSQWEEANVTAIYKAGNRKKAENYRQISIKPVCCRLFERILRNKIVEYLETNKILPPFEHVLRKGYSCVTHLTECIEDWSQATDEGKQVDVIYLDFKAAFDKVPHKRPT